MDKTKSINFLKFKTLAIFLSLIMIGVFIGGTLSKGGLNYGIDFVGGVKIITKFTQGKVDEKIIRESLAKYSPMVQQIGEESKHEFIVSTKMTEDGAKGAVGKATLKKSLSEKFPGVVFQSEERVGPAIGDFLKKSALKLFLVAVILMMLYLSFRFEVKYSLGAMAALLHDIIASVAFCGFAGVEINIPVVAALLTIFGYSVNDTIVIFDRIRENNQVKGKLIFSEVINKSITQSISRTLLTSLTTLFAVLSLYLLGGEVLNEFALVLLFGIFVGTYSSVYIAPPVLIAWDKMSNRKK